MNLHNLDPCVLELIPLLAHFSNEVTEEEMSTICTIHLIRTMGLSLIEPQNIEALFTASSVVIQKASQWKSKLVLLRFLQIFIVTNIFLIEGRQQAILELLLTLTMDPQFDVRVMAADTFSGLLSLSVFTVDETLLVSSNFYKTDELN